MKTCDFLLITIALTTASAFGAEEEMKGAKVLFEDVLKGTVVMPRQGPIRAAETSRSAPASSSETPMRRVNNNTMVEQTPTGVMYFLELKQADGKFAPVDRRRIFREGERVRLQIMSNVSGRLAVLQSANREPFQALFPGELHSERGHVIAGEPTALPSAAGWRFDGQPGQIRLLVMITADERRDPVERESAERRVEQTETANTPPTERPRKERPENRDDVRSQLEQQLAEQMRNSKALVEHDEPAESNRPYARYVVADPRRDSRIPKGIVVFEIVIQQN